MNKNKIIRSVLILLALLCLVYMLTYIVASIAADNDKQNDQRSYKNCLNYYKAHPNLSYPGVNLTPGKKAGPGCIPAGKIVKGFLNLPDYNPVTNAVFN